LCLGGGAAAAQGPAPCPSDAATAQLARQLFAKINAARAAASVPPLHWSAAAAGAARCHSQQMMQRGQLFHGGDQNTGPGDRLRRVGIVWSRVAENVGEATSIAAVQRMMMDEPRGQANHRANILDPQLHDLGVGIARRGEMLFITEDFYTPLHD